MKKHFLYVSTAALLAMSFASCVDNDEPRGLRELRYAKANEWNANADWKRATIYGDSLLHLYQAQEQDLLNKSQELANLLTQATNNYTIEKQNYQLALDKARIDYRLAVVKDSIARESLVGEKEIADAKAALVKAQQKLAEAQNQYDRWNAKAQYRKDSLNWEIKNLQATLEQSVLTTQKTLDNNKLAQEKWAAELEAKTYWANLENILTVAKMKKNVWSTDSAQVWSAYTTMKAKQDTMLKKQKALFVAQQEFLIAINGYEKDSVKNLKALSDKVNNAQYKLDWYEKSVTLAEKELADFNQYSKANKETWNKKYNEYQQALETLDNQVDEYDVQIAEAKAKYTADSLKYVNKKKEIEKPLKAYTDQANYHTFILDDAIAADTAFKLPKEAKHFELKQGVIANADTIKNSDLNAELDAILNLIGNDEKGSGTFYYNDKDIKAAKEAIAGFQKDTADLYDALDKKVEGYNAKIDLKNSDINTATQKLNERKNQTAIVTKFNTQKAAFEAAVTDYFTKRDAYIWSDKSGKSELYESTAATIADAIVAFNHAYAAEEGETSPDLVKASLKTLRKAIQTAANNSDYWNARTAFDGTKRYKDQDDTKYTDFHNWTAFDDAETLTKFDAFVLAGATKDARAAVKASDAAVTSLVNNILSGSNVATEDLGNVRAEGNDSGAWKVYKDAAKDFIGSTTRWDVPSDPEMVGKTDAELLTLGTIGEYYGWKRELAALEDEIAKLQSDPEKYDTDTPPYKKGDYKNPGIKEYKELIAKAEDQTAEDVAKKVEKIDSVQTKIDNSPLWADLYDDIKAVKDANDAQIKELTVAQQEAYKTDLVSFETAVTADQKSIDELQLAQDIAKAEKKYKEIAQGAYKKLVLKEVKDSAGNAMKDKDVEAEVIIKYALINLQFAIDEAKEGVEDQKIALANAKKDLEDFKAGEYDVKQNNYLATVIDADRKVKSAELDYEHATKDYEVAQQYYNDILAAVEEEE